MSCAVDQCSRPVGRNGVSCHAHFAAVPDFLRRAYFAARDPRTKSWLRAQVRHAVRGEQYAADPESVKV